MLVIPSHLCAFGSCEFLITAWGNMRYPVRIDPALSFRFSILLQMVQRVNGQITDIEIGTQFFDL